MSEIKPVTYFNSSEVIYLAVHGFNVKDNGDGSIGQLQEYLPALHRLNYGYNFRARVRLCADSEAMLIAGAVKALRATNPRKKIVIVGHSNGCNLIHRSMLHGAIYNKVIYVNPALDANLAIPLLSAKWSVYYSGSDKATLAAKFIPCSIWGAMGRVGYTGTRACHLIDLEVMMRKRMGHSDAFQYHRSKKIITIDMKTAF